MRKVYSDKKTSPNWWLKGSFNSLWKKKWLNERIRFRWKPERAKIWASPWSLNCSFKSLLSIFPEIKAYKSWLDSLCFKLCVSEYIFSNTDSLNWKTQEAFFIDFWCSTLICILSFFFNTVSLSLEIWSLKRLFSSVSKEIL